jgi:GNAT superfamily N-acetyltransferase/sugar phosphate isomerase/epimerase
MQFVRINISNTHLLENFVSRAGKSLETFRYFAKRPFSIVQNHACTWVIEEDGQVEAYGHLDREGDTVWLGIAVTDHARGKGYGRKMMQRLMDSASAQGISRVKLSVDNANEAAIRLYERFGFRLVEKRETFSFYAWRAVPLRKAVMSSLAFMGHPAETVIETCKTNDFILEFSSGMPYRPDMESIFLDAPVRRFAHNYFPAPEVPFVLNLGSGDEEIRRKSILHCVNGIRLSAAVGAPFFSAHAGFCVDPKPDELGRQLSRVKSFDRERHWDLFLESVREVLNLTADLPTGFLLENNVLAKMNVYEDGSNPLLCADAPEMLRFIEEIADPRAGILLDTAHLKVSALTLGFGLEEAAKKVLPATRCIHHSDNEGLHDNNQPFGADYWFLPLVLQAEYAIHVLEVRKQNPEELKAMEKLLFS